MPDNLKGYLIRKKANRVHVVTSKATVDGQLHEVLDDALVVGLDRSIVLFSAIQYLEILE